MPPLLQSDAAGGMQHAYERNRTDALDPRTGLGNSQVEQDSMRSGSPNVNQVNQELNLEKRPGAARRGHQGQR